MRKILQHVVALSLLALMSSVAAQEFPSRPVKVMVAFPAGGSADIVARIVSQQLTEQMNQSFVVDNRPGAGGNIAFQAAAKADPDGYTLLLSTPGVVMNPTLYSKSARFVPDDFVGIYLVGEAPLLILSSPSFPANTLQDVIALAKQQPDRVRYASAGSGSSSHLAAEIFRHMAGLKMVHVPYKGGGAAFQDVMNGNVEITAQPIAESLPLVTSGKLRALAQTGPQRSSMAPDIPTVAEAGVPGYSLTTWYVMLAPAKTPPAIVARLASEMDKAVKNPAVRERLKKSGVEVVGFGPEQTASFVKTEFEKYAKLLKESGAQVE